MNDTHYLPVFKNPSKTPVDPCAKAHAKAPLKAQSQLPGSWFDKEPANASVEAPGN